MVADIPELTAHLGYWLRQVSNHVSYAFSRKLAARDVTVAEWAVMRMLYGRELTSPSQLADDMALTRGAVSKLADRLINKELIAKEQNPNDGRAHKLKLTKVGMSLVPELAALADQNETECFGQMSDDDRQALERVLKDTVARLGIVTTPLE